MKHRAALGGVALLLLVAGTAAGCGGDAAESAPLASSSPTPTETDTPQTPEEYAEADAEAAITRYFKVTDEVARNPKTARDKLKTVAAGTVLLSDQSDFEGWRNQGWRQTGAMRVTKTRVESVSLDNSAPKKGVVPTVVIMACTDASGVKVVGNSGDSVVPDDRPEEFTTKYIVANYSWKTDKHGGWLVATAEDQKVGSCTL